MNECVIAVIYHKIQSNKKTTFLQWQKEITSASETFDGYIKTVLIEPSLTSENEYIVIFKFKNNRCLNIWKKSSIRREFLKSASDFTVGSPVLKTYYSLEHWFKKQNSTTSQSKMTIVSFFAIWPLVHFIPPISNQYLEFSSILNEAITTILITICMSYFALPLMIRLFKPWLK
jgi:antibiotic biosynthesis monooxygenase (ABM) superfamily enzyme